MAVTTNYPFGLRDVKLFEITDVDTPTYANGVDLPAAQTFAFAPEVTSEVLEGDDETVAIHVFEGRGTWDLESGGISLAAWAVLTGGTVTDSDATPNQVSYMDVLTTLTRPYFGVIGRAITEAAGDTHLQIFKAKCNEGPSGEFAFGTFRLSSASGMAIGDANDRLYRTLNHETETAIPDAWPTDPYTSS